MFKRLLSKIQPGNNSDVRRHTSSGPSTTVVLRDEAGDEVSKIDCYEEPNVLGLGDGYGYFPLSLGQFIHEGKLEIVRKLGWGQNSTVWLARTHNNAFPTKYIAVKILTAHTSYGVFSDLVHETDMLQRIKANSSNSRHVGSRYCLRMLDMFPEESRHGPHLCIAMEMLGGSIVDLRREFKMENALPVALVKSIVKQKLKALDFLHGTCGIVHTDIKPDNVLVHVPNIDTTIEQNLTNDPSTTYPPRIEPAISPEPIITAKSQPLTFTHDLMDYGNGNVEIRLADFGEAQEVDKRMPDEVQAVELRAPEVILGYPWSTPIDIWSIGCLTFEYLTGVSLFQLDSPCSDADADDDTDKNTGLHLQRMMEITGEEFEAGFLSQCGMQKQRNYFDTKTCKLLHTKKLEPRSLNLETGLAQFGVRKEEVPAAAAFIRKCLALDPKRRASADQLLGDGWLAGVSGV